MHSRFPVEVVLKVTLKGSDVGRCAAPKTLCLLWGWQEHKAASCSGEKSYPDQYSHFCPTTEATGVQLSFADGHPSENTQSQPYTATGRIIFCCCSLSWLTVIWPSYTCACHRFHRGKPGSEILPRRCRLLCVQLFSLPLGVLLKPIKVYWPLFLVGK